MSCYTALALAKNVAPLSTFAIGARRIEEDLGQLDEVRRRHLQLHAGLEVLQPPPKGIELPLPRPRFPGSHRSFFQARKAHGKEPERAHGLAPRRIRQFLLRPPDLRSSAGSMSHGLLEPALPQAILRFRQDVLDLPLSLCQRPRL